jgi:hypothetical protein
VIVFGLPKPVRPGTRVTQEGKKKLVAKVGRERAFFFYQDSAPFLAYPHPGRVALVGAKSGKVKLSKAITRRPLVNGRLPAFLKSTRAYRDQDYVIYDGSSNGTQAAADDPFGQNAIQALVEGGNTTPVAHDQTVTVKQNSPKNIRLTATDPDLPPGSESGDLLTFEITKPPNHGTLSGTPPDVTYTPNFGRLGPDHFFFTASDGDAVSKEAKISINVVPRGVPSTVATSAGCTAYTEQAPAVVVDDQITVFDPDDTVLDSARVRVVGFEFGDGDDLRFTDQNGITGSYSDFEGVLTLRGDASVANYEAALRSVSYRNLSDANPPPTKDIEFTVNDAGGDSLPAVKQICITGGGNGGGNDKPTGETSEGGLSYIENDGPVPLDAGFVVGDPDSASLSGATIKFIPIVTQEVDENGEPVGDPVVTDTFAPDEDELAFAPQNGITGIYDDETGLLTLSGSASLADYETAIRSVTYENTSEDPSDAIRRLEFQVTDSGGASSTPSRRDLFITPVNDAPVLNTSDEPLAYTEGDGPVAADEGITATDVDSDDLVGATVEISSGYTPGEDSLAFTDQNGITGTYDADNGKWTLSGTASVADYETALRSVTYENSSEDPSDATRTLTFQADDGGDVNNLSDPVTRDITVTPVNDAPVVTTTAGSTAYTEGDPATTVDSGVTVADVDDTELEGAQVRISESSFQSGDELVFAPQNGISGVYNTGTGELTLTGTASLADYQTALASIKYRHTGDNPSAAKTVEFTVNDGDDDSNTATKDIAVTPVNDPPVLDTTDAALAYSEGDGAVPIDDAISVTDPDSATLSEASVTVTSGFAGATEDEIVFTDQNGITGTYDATHDTITLSGTASVADYQAALRSLTYENLSENPSTATRTVGFKANDGQLDADPATRDITVAAVNDAPVVETTEGTTEYTIGGPAVEVDTGVAVNDADDANIERAEVRVAAADFEAGDQLELDEETLSGGMAVDFFPGTGILTVTGPASAEDYRAALAAIKFQHTGGEPTVLSKTIEFKVNDGELDSATATKTVDLVTPNDVPVVTTSAGNSTYTLGDTNGVVVDGALTVTDGDDANLQSAVVDIQDREEGDELLFTDEDDGISWTVDETGSLILNGDASVAAYEAALRTVRFRNTETATLPGDRTVTFMVNDGDDDSNVATKTVDLVAPLPPEL